MASTGPARVTCRRRLILREVCPVERQFGFKVAEAVLGVQQVLVAQGGVSGEPAGCGRGRSPPRSVPDLLVDRHRAIRFDAEQHDTSPTPKARPQFDNPIYLFYKLYNR